MSDRTTILVTGGTGRIGSAVVRELQGRGFSVRVLTRGRRPHQPLERVEFTIGDLATVTGIDSALQGIETVVHCAASMKWPENQGQVRNLIAAARDARIKHLVFVSVVGADRVPTPGRIDRAMFGYFSMMGVLEQMIMASGLPWSILRATQFYQALILIARIMARLPLVPVPSGFRFQPVDTRDVAVGVADLAIGNASGIAPDVGGPRIYPADELFRSYLHAAHKRRPLLRIPIPGTAARVVRDGAILAPDRATGRRTWEEFLAECLSPARASV
ncbi:MAG TPA: SDR family oxidoreductase [Candidatus Dormibacteraeota bacterium]